MKLSWKLSGTFMILSLVAVTMLGVLVFETSSRTLEADIGNHVASISLLKASQFDLWVDANKESLERIVQRPLLYELTSVLSTEAINTEAYNAAYDDIYENHLTRLALDSLGFTEIFILHPDTGQILVSSDEAQVGKYRENQLFFEEGRNRTYIQNPYYSITRQAQIITIATPLNGDNDDNVGILAGHLDLDVASDIMLSGFLDFETADTFLVNRFNFFVTSSRFDNQIADNRSVHSDGVTQCLEQQTGTDTYVNHLGVRVIGSYRWIDEHDLCILTEIRSSEAFAPVLELRNTMIGLSSVVVLVSIGMGAGVSRTITRPVQKLVEDTKIIGSGNLDHRIITTAKDEIGELSHAFDQMVGNLKAMTASRDELESEIQQRKALEKSLREREATLALALKAAQAGVWQWHITDDVLKWDETVEAMHWLERGTFSGEYEDWTPLVHPDDIERVEQDIQRALDGTEPYETEMRIVHPDGQIRTILSQGIVEKDEDATPVRMIGVAIDITRRKQIEKKAREREATLSLALKAAQAGVWQWHIASGGITWDAIMDQIHGLEIGTFGGTYDSWRSSLHPEDIDATVEAVEQAVAGIKPYDTTFRIVRPDGEIRYVLAQGIVIRNEEHEPTSMIGVNIDVTERKQAEQALENTKNDLIERVKELSGLQDIGQFEEENLPLDAYFRKVAARIPASMQFPDMCQVAIEFEGQVFGDIGAMDSPWKIQEYIHNHDNIQGHLYVAYTQQQAFLGEERDYIHAVADRIGHYISRTQLHEELRETLQNLTRSNQELEQFAYVASHDLQEPLRMVTNYLQLFKKRYEGKVDERADKYIFYAVDGASRMKTLINDLLTFSRVTTQGAEFKETNLDNILESALNGLKLLVDDTNASITTDPLPTVMADKTQMLQLFQNLIGNAIKFRGEKQPVIHISVTRGESNWKIVVEDNGIGIEPEYLDQIFVIFQRLHTRQEYEGTGIGLSVCKRIVERHGGNIWVESQPDVGSKFLFTMPILEVEDERNAN